MIDSPRFDRDLRSLKEIAQTGESLPDTLVQRFRREFPDSDLELVTAYAAAMERIWALRSYPELEGFDAIA